MIQLYTNNQQDLTKNGVILNSIIISGKIHTVLNGENELEMDVALDKDGLYKHITRGCLITTPTPDFEEDQAYRIYDTVKNMSSNIMTVYARHIQFDLNKKIIFNKNVQGNGQKVIEKILEDTKFKGTSNSNITDIRQYKMKNIINVLNGNDEDSFINVWGGEIECNNYNLNIPLRRGADRGVRVTFGYNLEDIEEDINSDEVVTRIYPYSGDLVLSGNKPYVDSPLIAKYSDVYEQSIEMADIKVKEKTEDEDGFDTRAEAEAEMIRRCIELYNKGADKIKANYKVKMQDLSKTIEYKRLGYDVLEKICLGDTVHCYNKNIDIEISARCISYTWDIINEEFIEIELGQFISNYIDNNLSDLDNIYRKIVLTEQFITLRVDSLDNTLHSEIKISEEGIISSVNKTIETTKTDLQNNIDITNKDLESNIKGVKETITQTKTDLLSKIELTEQSINSTVSKQMTESISTSTSKLHNDISSTKDELKNNINSTKKDLQNNIDKTKNDLSGSINGVKDDLNKTNSNLQGQIDSVTERVSTIKSSIEQLPESITSTVSKQITETKKELQGNIDGIANTVVETNSKITQTAEGIYKDINNTKEGLELNITETAEGITKTINSNKEEIQKNIDTFGRETTDKLSNMNSKIEQTAKGINETITATKRDVDSKMSSLETEIDKTAKGIKACVREDDFGTMLEENSKSIIASIHGKTDNKVTIDEDGLTITDGGFKFESSNGTIIEAIGSGGIRLGDSAWSKRKSMSKIYLGENDIGQFFMLSNITIDDELDMDRKNIDNVKKFFCRYGECNGDFYVDDTLHCESLSVEGGSKHGSMKTAHYGKRLLNAYETAGYYYGDIGSGKIKNGECMVALDPIWLECVNTNIEYHVFTQAYSGEILRIERYKNYFIVFGEDGTEFSWEAKAKILGHENGRLDTQDINNPKNLKI